LFTLKTCALGFGLCPNASVAFTPPSSGSAIVLATDLRMKLLREILSRSVMDVPLSVA
jgi:hypothetical protein